MRDDQLAAQLGRTRLAVAHRRRKYRLPAFEPRLKPWTTQQISLLGKFTDAEVARRTGRAPWLVQAKRRSLGIPVLRDPLHRPWTPAEDALLGTASPRDIARRLGRPLSGVYGRRHKLGLPRYRRTQSPNASP
jgi:hypothetical protein